MKKEIHDTIVQVTEQFLKRKISPDATLEFDSMTIIEYLFELESALNIVIDVTQVKKEDFTRLETIEKFIESSYKC